MVFQYTTYSYKSKIELYPKRSVILKVLVTTTKEPNLKQRTLKTNTTYT